MKRTIIKVFAVCMCLALLAVSFAGCKKLEKDTYVIGVSGPLTGGNSGYGVAVKNSA